MSGFVFKRQKHVPIYRDNLPVITAKRIMPARDIYHNTVKNALEKSGWQITADPLFIKYGEINLYIDLAADNMLAAEKNGEQIAIEIKSFSSISLIHEFHAAIGQFINYRIALQKTNSNRKLFLAVENETYQLLFKHVLVKDVIEIQQISYFVFNAETEEITLWQT